MRNSQISHKVTSADYGIEIRSYNFDMAAKKRKKRKIQISHLINSDGYRIEIREF